MLIIWGIACGILYSKGLISIEGIAVGTIIVLCHEDIVYEIGGIQRRLK